MLPVLRALATALEETGRRLRETPADRGVHRELLRQIQAMAELAQARALPLFLRSHAKEVELRAARVARRVEAGDEPSLEEALRSMREGIDELLAALERGRA